MKLTVLVDNVAWIGKGEWGFSCYIEDGDTNVLLDVGTTGLFIENAQKLNVDLFNLDYLVFSHGHYDHIWGFGDLIKRYARNPEKKRPSVVAHPLTFCPKLSTQGIEIGSIISKDSVRFRFPLKLSSEPLWLTERLVWLGEIKRKHSFEEIAEPMKIVKDDGTIEPDYLLDDSALAYKSEEGLVIITGCSHSGICNILEQAKRICSEERIVDIIGGLHLIGASEEKMEGTLDYVRKANVKQMHAGHCTGFEAQLRLGEVTDIRQLGSGLTLEYL